ncbi:hypothetical protein MAR_010962 [Mya arenaria]|uniref:Uncharacterized protein n=1 Tax=Mya arenaria TaxID=6604 RepID=A0ABY7FSR0_MYAAR|nr:hypothetical protein MAR_010962 [Mya arenaria]
MAKSRSEIQKAYRERQKAKGSAFLEKEKVRQRGYYKPAFTLSERKGVERNSKNKLRNRFSRMLKQQQQQQDGLSQGNETSGYESGTPEGTQQELQEPSRRIVRLPTYSNKSRGIKTVKARALARSNKKVRQLKELNESLRKKLKVRNRKISRISKRLNEVKHNTTVNSTPKKQTEADLQSLKLTHKSKQAIRRKLLLSNTVMSEIKSARESTLAKRRQGLHCIVSGRIARKYRFLNQIQRQTGLSRKSLAKVMNKNLVNITHSKSRLCIARNLKSQVIEFLSRDDNSRSQPGKADAKKTESGEKQQTRVLTDYVGNLYDKFLSENPGTKLSKTTFQRLRPKNILLTSFISRNTCHCVHHQNMALNIQSLRKLGIKIGQNPEHLIARQDELDNILENLPENVNFKTWKKVESEGKMRMKSGARWNYFEVGHGKGPCDGLGGTVKHIADGAIKQGHTVIQDAEEFFKWGIMSSMKDVKFIYVSKTETQKKQNAMGLITAKPVKGTMKMHAVGMSKEANIIMTRETSCYCHICLSGNYCSTWQNKYSHIQPHDHTKNDNEDNAIDCVTKDNGPETKTTVGVRQTTVETDQSEKAVQNEETVPAVKVGDFVAALYESKWYIGQVVDNDIDNAELEINFMTRAKEMNKWPQYEDRIWIESNDIICRVQSLSPSGKSERLFRLSTEEAEKI